MARTFVCFVVRLMKFVFRYSNYNGASPERHWTWGTSDNQWVHASTHTNFDSVWLIYFYIKHGPCPYNTVTHAQRNARETKTRADVKKILDEEKF